MLVEFTTYLKNLIPEFASLIVLIVSLYNNPYRFSIEQNFINLEHYKMTFLIYFIMIILIVLILYCKSFTYLNHTQFFSITLPFIIILIPFLGIVSVMFISNQVFVFKLFNKKNKFTYLPISEKNKMFYKDNDIDIADADHIPSKDYSSPPSYFLNKKTRMLIFTFNLMFVLFTLYLFIDYFKSSKDVYKSKLQKLLTSNPNSKISLKIIYTLIGMLIILNLFLIYQQYTFSPCNIGLPDSWNI